MEIEGLTPAALRALPSDELNALLAFGRPITFRIGSATVLAEFNKDDDCLTVNLAHIDGGGEGVLVSLWKLVTAFAKDRGYHCVLWNVHALTCDNPNPRLQKFLCERGFVETHSERHGRVLSRLEPIQYP
ncbi:MULTISPECIES: hypothetical protein [unclassified Sphingomonas]|uniref:hypothetical protein n=1 Tax=unclassified Sphingomonas TaxID=196159 RepID=UPI00215121A0|nr:MULTISPECIES: hypothetical protein [unclassified Sphingomonas]MCR5870415.1 hypothetical protein [Sphingomonas sp. J344]UUY01240.1 hypothetical protein LRS08_09515 [Sphingomonas sp. J315]